MTLSYTCKRLTRATLLLCVAWALTGCQGLPFEQPPFHWNQNMDFQTRLDAQQESAFFADRRAMRMPVEGTVARGELRTDPHRHLGVVDGAHATTLPMPLSAELLERGQERYDIFCAPCHGYNGDGKGVVPARSTWIVPTFHADRARSMPVGQLYEIITVGVGTMPAYRSQLQHEDRWAVAAYVRALQVSQGMAASSLPGELRPSQQRGR